MTFVRSTYRLQAIFSLQDIRISMFDTTSACQDRSELMWLGLRGDYAHGCSRL